MFTKKIITILFLASGFAVKAQSTSSLNLLPVPSNIELKAGSFSLTENFTVAVHQATADTILIEAVNRMYQTLNRRSGLYFKQKYISSKNSSDTASLQVTVGKSVPPSPGADESYSLVITSDRVALKAPTTLGALHGLETILQLLSKRENGEFYFPSVAIQDAPRFSWRGLMIDVSRHFIPVDVLKRNIDAMAAVKMNVLHLHLTDNEGFRVESKTFPQLQNKGSNGDYYTQAQIKELISFAEGRGIIIVPEFDMPGHTKSWFAGYPQLASAPGPYEPGSPIDFHSVQQMNLGSIMQMLNNAPFPAIDPSRESTYEFIDKFIAEMSSLFSSPFIHIGADENNGVAWKNNPSIVAFMKTHDIPNTHELQAYFVERVNKIVAKHHKQMIGWEELFSKNLVKDVTVQVWQNPAYTKQALDNGNPVLISRGFYLDLFMPAYVHHNNPDLPAGLTGENTRQLRGGEAAQWAEVADKTNIETRIWPRAAAIAEKLWSDTLYNDADDLYRRLFVLSEQLDESGLQHVANYERALRRYANDEVGSLKTLTDVLTPVKGYKKLFAQLMMPESMSYQTAPLIQVSDIVFVDSKVKWKFRAAVKSYLEHKEVGPETILRNYLQLWQNNNDQLKDLFVSSPQLKRVEEHSKNLSVIATIGLEAIDKLKSGTTDSNWINEKLSFLKTTNQVYGETELSVIPEIEALVRQQMTPLPTTYPVF
jgi:hexosaminidase